MEAAADPDEIFGSQSDRLAPEAAPGPPEQELANLRLTSPTARPATKRRNRRLSGIQPCSSHRMTLRSGAQGKVQLSPVQASFSALRLDSTSPSPSPLTPFDQLVSPVSSVFSVGSTTSLSSGTDVSVAECAEGHGGGLKDASDGTGQKGVSNSSMQPCGGDQASTPRRSLVQMNPEPSGASNVKTERRSVGGKGSYENIMLHSCEEGKENVASGGVASIEDGENNGYESEPPVKSRKPTQNEYKVAPARNDKRRASSVFSPPASDNRCPAMEEAVVEKPESDCTMASVVSTSIATSVPQPGGGSSSAPQVNIEPSDPIGLSSAVRKSRRRSAMHHIPNASIDTDLRVTTDSSAPSHAVLEKSALDKTSAAQPPPVRRSRRRSALFSPSNVSENAGLTKANVCNDLAPTPTTVVSDPPPEDGTIPKAPAVRKSRRRSGIFVASGAGQDLCLDTGAHDAVQLVGTSVGSSTEVQGPVARKSRRRSGFYVPSGSITEKYADFLFPNGAQASCAVSERVSDASSNTEATSKISSVRKSRRRSSGIFLLQTADTASDLDARFHEVTAGPAAITGTWLPESTARDSNAALAEAAVRTSRRRTSGRFTPLAASDQPTPRDAAAVDTQPTGDVQIHIACPDTAAESEVALRSSVCSATESILHTSVINSRESVLAGHPTLSEELVDYYLNKPYAAPQDTILETIAEEGSGGAPARRRQRRCASKGSVRRCEFNLTESKQRLRKLKATRVKTLNKVLHRRGKTKQAGRLVAARLRELDAFYMQCEEEEVREATKNTLLKIKKRKDKASTHELPLSAAQHMEVEALHVSVETLGSCMEAGTPVKTAPLVPSPPCLSSPTKDSLESSDTVALSTVQSTLPSQLQPTHACASTSGQPDSQPVSSPVSASSPATSKHPVFATPSPRQITRLLTSTTVQRSSSDNSTLTPSTRSVSDASSTPPTTSWEDAAFVFATPQPLSTRADQLHFPTPRLQRPPSPERMDVTPGVATEPARACPPASGSRRSGGSAGPVEHAPVPDPSPSVESVTAPPHGSAVPVDLSFELMFSTPQKSLAGSDGVECRSSYGNTSVDSCPMHLEMTGTSTDSVEIGTNDHTPVKVGVGPSPKSLENSSRCGGIGDETTSPVVGGRLTSSSRNDQLSPLIG